LVFGHLFIVVYCCLLWFIVVYCCLLWFIENVSFLFFQGGIPRWQLEQRLDLTSDGVHEARDGRWDGGGAQTVTGPGRGSPTTQPTWRIMVVCGRHRKACNAR
jgi:hypothetical protein